jgi:hypothetical protein
VRRFAFPSLCVAVGVGVGVYQAIEVGRATAAGAFLAVAAAALAWCLGLLFRAARALVDEPPAVEVERATGRRRKELEREKAHLLKALKELEFDHEMGKVSDADFREIGGQYRGRAMRVMRQLDDAGEGDYRALVERELKARLGAPKGAPAKLAARPLCPDCSTENDLDAVFCKKCGRRFAREAS